MKKVRCSPFEGLRHFCSTCRKHGAFPVFTVEPVKQVYTCWVWYGDDKFGQSHSLVVIKLGKHSKQPHTVDDEDVDKVHDRYREGLSLTDCTKEMIDGLPRCPNRFPRLLNKSARVQPHTENMVVLIFKLPVQVSRRCLEAAVSPPESTRV